MTAGPVGDPASATSHAEHDGTESRGAAALVLEGEVVMDRAVEIKQALLAAIAGEGPFGLDLGAVTELDCAGVQLLLLARELARARQREVVVVACSAAARDVLALLRLAGSFNVPPAPGAELAR